MDRLRGWLTNGGIRVGSVVAVVVLAGCLGGGGPVSSPTSTTTEAPSTTETPTATQAATTATGATTTTANDDSGYGEQAFQQYEQGAGTQSFPDPPADLTNDTAKQAALEYEQVYVFTRLRNQSYGRYAVPSGGDPTATVVNRSATGVYVRVTMPYSYAAGNAYYSNTTRALYHVTTTRIRRVTATGLQLL